MSFTNWWVSRPSNVICLHVYIYTCIHQALVGSDPSSFNWELLLIGLSSLYESHKTLRNYLIHLKLEPRECARASGDMVGTYGSNSVPWGCSRPVCTLGAPETCGPLPRPLCTLGARAPQSSSRAAASWAGSGGRQGRLGQSIIQYSIA